VLGIRVVYPDPDVYPSRILTFMHPGSNNSNKREGEKISRPTFFLFSNFTKLRNFEQEKKKIEPIP
jgi:hypothetical protein